ncbi:MAG: glycosyltransferase family 4 protein [Butyrivibrio sp.]|nr:glycosyltransferase family 4 protein [Butyrivibrio sp.]
MSKILILANSSGGLYDFRNELITRLIAQRDEVVISLPDELRVPELMAEGARVVHTDINRRGMNPIEDFKLLKAYENLIEAEKPDMVVTYTIKPNVYGGFAARKKGVPFISTITGLGSAFQDGGLKKSIIKHLVITMYKVGLKGCSCVFFQNKENQNKFKRFGITKKLKTRLVNGSGVDLEKHVPQDYPGHEDNVVRFLYVGRLMKEKGTAEYLEAAHLMHEKYGNKVSVATIGYFDEDFGELIEQARKRGELKTIPFNKDIRPYLKEADVIVMPSYHEGMSNVLMEASATARPVLASNISGCKEIVDDGETGFLFKKQDAKALFDAMDRMASLDVSQRRAMGLLARAKVEREFDRHSIIDAYIDELLNVMEKM